MSLRPRYSLLTLLILTAIFAGGVKLWYGPHHVVERPEPNKEWECTYTRDCWGNRHAEGPVVTRTFHADGSVERTTIHYARKGDVTYSGTVVLTAHHERKIFSHDNLELFRLLPHEKQILEEATQIELARFQAAGLTSSD